MKLARANQFIKWQTVTTAVMLFKAGVVDVNSQHRMNKWTALHWAAKRNNPGKLHHEPL